MCITTFVVEIAKWASVMWRERYSPEWNTSNNKIKRFCHTKFTPAMKTNIHLLFEREKNCVSEMLDCSTMINHWLWSYLNLSIFEVFNYFWKCFLVLRRKSWNSRFSPLNHEYSDLKSPQTVSNLVVESFFLIWLSHYYTSKLCTMLFILL